MRLLLSCGVVVRADGEFIIVQTLDPQVMMNVPERAELQLIADGAGRPLWTALGNPGGEVVAS
jgi:hypothetical protein